MSEPKLNIKEETSELRIPKEKTVAALEEMGLTPTIRGEKLSLEEFAKLSDILGR